MLKSICFVILKKKMLFDVIEKLLSNNFKFKKLNQNVQKFKNCRFCNVRKFIDYYFYVKQFNYVYDERKFIFNN